MNMLAIIRDFISKPPFHLEEIGHRGGDEQRERIFLKEMKILPLLLYNTKGIVTRVQRRISFRR